MQQVSDAVGGWGVRRSRRDTGASVGDADGAATRGCNECNWCVGPLLAVSSLLIHLQGREWITHCCHGLID